MCSEKGFVDKHRASNTKAIIFVFKGKEIIYILKKEEFYCSAQHRTKFITLLVRLLFNKAQKQFENNVECDTQLVTVVA